MSRLAVKAFCEKQLATLAEPMACNVLKYRPKQVTFGEDVALVLVDDPETEETPLVIVLGPIGQQVEHRVRLEIYWASADEEKGATLFDALLERIDQLFRKALKSAGGGTNPMAVVCPETGAQSTITEIGKRITTHQDSAVLDEEPQGLVAFTAEKTLVVKEFLQS